MESQQSDGEWGGGEEGEEYRTIHNGKALSEEQLQAAKKKEEEKKKFSLKQWRSHLKNQRKRGKTSSSEEAPSRINRYNPYDTASRRLITSEPNTLQAGRHRPSSGESGSTSSSSVNPGSVGDGHGRPLLPSSNTSSDIKLLITRVDRGHLDRDDIFTIQAELASADIKLLESNPSTNTFFDITQTKTVNYGRGYHIFCNVVEALTYYKTALEACTELPANNTAGYKCYLPGEKPPGHRIMGRLYRTHWRNKDKLHLAFCAGSRGKVKPDQVCQYRDPKMNTDNMMFLYLEIDTEAFEWLRSVNWSSRIGGSQICWRAPNIKGLTGVYRPDEDLEQIKAAMIESLNSISPAESTPEEESIADNFELLEVTSTAGGSVLTQDLEQVLNESGDLDTTLTQENVQIPALVLPEPDPTKSLTQKNPRTSPEASTPKHKISRSRHNSDTSEDKFTAGSPKEPTA